MVVAFEDEPIYFFSYGIFLDRGTRQSFGMYTEPMYATVRGYATVGHTIVEAVEAPGYTLTGLLIEVQPEIFDRLDVLEGGYERITVTTDKGFEAQMYIAPNNNWEG